MTVGYPRTAGRRALNRNWRGGGTKGTNAGLSIAEVNPMEILNESGVLGCESECHQDLKFEEIVKVWNYITNNKKSKKLKWIELT